MTLPEKLLASTSFQGFRSELLLRKTLQDHGWDAFQGTYYKDLDTKKLREIDVIARRTWALWADHHVQLALEVIVEAKTMKGFHLLFAPFVSAPEFRQAGGEVTPGHLMRQWIGSEGANRRYLAQILQRAGVNESDAQRLLGLMGKSAYPDGTAVIQDLMIDPPSVQWYGGAFRETNIGSEKELENSVLWRATSSLISGVRGLKRARLRSRLATLKVVADVGARDGDLSMVINEIRDGVLGFDQFHPVVAVDASLWQVAENGLTEIPWCRMILANSRGYPHFWVDVVRIEEFGRYCETVLNDYSVTLQAVGAESGAHEFLL